MKTFYNLTPECIQGLPYRFWLRETISAYIRGAIEGLSEFRQAIFKDEIIFLLLLLVIPVSIILGIAVIAKRKYITRRISRGNSVNFFNKKNIEYLTVFEVLHGDNTPKRRHYTFS